MRILLIRHAVTAETGARLTGRLSGVPLSPQGVSMAEELARGLATRRIDAVYTSPIERCRQTATIIADAHGLGACDAPDLIETDFGSWSGRTLKSVARLAAWKELMSSASRFRFPGGETLLEVQRRAVARLEQLAVEHTRGTIAVVTHADVIRVALSHYLGSPLDLVHRLHVDPASVSVVELAKGGVLVPLVNWTGAS